MPEPIEESSNFSIFAPRHQHVLNEIKKKDTAINHGLRRKRGFLFTTTNNKNLKFDTGQHGLTQTLIYHENAKKHEENNNQ